MKFAEWNRNFPCVLHPIYADPSGKEGRLLLASSAIGNYEDAISKPGSSFLWIGKEHHLSREEVMDFVSILEHWLRTGRLESQNGTTGWMFRAENLSQALRAAADFIDSTDCPNSFFIDVNTDSIGMSVSIFSIQK